MSGGVPDLVLVGHPFSAIGMAEHVRSTQRALRAVGVKAGLLDVYGMDRGKDPDFEREFGGDVVTSLSPRTNLFCINADEVEQAMGVLRHIGSGPAFERAHNIIYPAWELAKYPEPWARILEQFDEVWAPSEFIRQAVAGAVARRVVHMPLAVEITVSAFLGRRHFGIPENAFVCLFFFDFSSYAERKNPFAMLEAFEKLAALRPNAPLHVVVKYKGGKDDNPGRRALEARLAALGSRAQAITRELSDNEIKNLVRCADAFVSLHRSEGFGRGPAEAMVMGRAAVATGYSGNLDYMTPQNSRLVDYELIPVAKGAYLFGEDQVWADASVDHAVRLLAELVDDPAEARALGARARRHIRTHFSARAIGLRYSARLEELADS
ncbi:glycosyltransferase family 4 protein [Phenylobacterium sp.]|uniref:glycosyltransferase family 4 protein n=1 Tax=Phenylobacterium sp. TaxID=1871053 RepID=UPI00273749F8|nr:glycosyltransferase family 4 protein [Phenylobacterium sp.]MDP3856089.1 glycosyltransferase family 4 protein [Phenylobacterium sp.]